MLLFRFTCLIALSSVSTVGSVSAATNTTCPTWFYYDNSTQQCLCGTWLSCTGNSLVEIEDSSCATYAGEGSQYYIGGCPFRHTINNTDSVHSEMPHDPLLLDDFMCGPYKRRGLLCGSCIEGFGPTGLVLDLKCANCSVFPERYAIPVYLALQIVPVTLFFILVTLFNFNITSGPLLGYTVFSQVYLVYMKQNVYMYAQMQASVPESLQTLFITSLAVFRFWNLQYAALFVPPFCISERLTELQVQLLSLIPAAFPVVLVVVTFTLMELHARNCRTVHVLWKPFSIVLDRIKIRTVTPNAVIHAFASFIFLANASTYTTMCDVLNNMNIFRQNSTIYQQSVNFNPTLKWLGHQHIRYIMAGSIPFILLTLTPSIFYVLYPTRVYRYLSRFISGRKRLAITAFAEALQASLKDGLNGTRDCRALIGLIPVIPLIYIIPRQILTYPPPLIDSFNLAITSCVFLYIQPCKQAMANISIGYNLLLLAGMDMIIYLWAQDKYIESLQQMFVALPLMSHGLVCLWAGYTLTRRMVDHCGRHFNLRDVGTALADRVHSWLQRTRRGSYQELT